MSDGSRKRVAYRVAHRSRWMNIDWIYGALPCIVEQSFWDITLAIGIRVIIYRGSRIKEQI